MATPAELHQFEIQFFALGVVERDAGFFDAGDLVFADARAHPIAFMDHGFLDHRRARLRHGVGALEEREFLAVEEDDAAQGQVWRRHFGHRGGDVRRARSRLDEERPAFFLKQIVLGHP